MFKKNTPINGLYDFLTSNHANISNDLYKDWAAYTITENDFSLDLYRDVEFDIINIKIKPSIDYRALQKGLKFNKKIIVPCKISLDLDLESFWRLFSDFDKKFEQRFGLHLSELLSDQNNVNIDFSRKIKETSLLEFITLIIDFISIEKLVHKIIESNNQSLLDFINQILYSHKHIILVIHEYSLAFEFQEMVAKKASFSIETTHNDSSFYIMNDVKYLLLPLEKDGLNIPNKDLFTRIQKRSAHTDLNIEFVDNAPFSKWIKMGNSLVVNTEDSLISKFSSLVDVYPHPQQLKMFFISYYNKEIDENTIIDSIYTILNDNDSSQDLNNILYSFAKELLNEDLNYQQQITKYLAHPKHEEKFVTIEFDEKVVEAQWYINDTNHIVNFFQEDSAIPVILQLPLILKGLVTAASLKENNYKINEAIITNKVEDLTELQKENLVVCFNRIGIVLYKKVEFDVDEFIDSTYYKYILEAPSRKIHFKESVNDSIFIEPSSELMSTPSMEITLPPHHPLPLECKLIQKKVIPASFFVDNLKKSTINFETLLKLLHKKENIIRYYRVLFPKDKSYTFTKFIYLTKHYCSFISLQEHHNDDIMTFSLSMVAPIVMQETETIQKGAVNIYLHPKIRKIIELLDIKEVFVNLLFQSKSILKLDIEHSFIDLVSTLDRLKSRIVIDQNLKHKMKYFSDEEFTFLQIFSSTTEHITMDDLPIIVQNTPNATQSYQLVFYQDNMHKQSIYLVNKNENFIAYYEGIKILKEHFKDINASLQNNLTNNLISRVLKPKYLYDTVKKVIQLKKHAAQPYSQNILSEEFMNDIKRVDWKQLLNNNYEVTRFKDYPAQSYTLETASTKAGIILGDSISMYFHNILPDIKDRSTGHIEFGVRMYSY